MSKNVTKKLFDENVVDAVENKIFSTVTTKNDVVEIVTGLHENGLWYIDVKSGDGDYSFNMGDDAYIAIKSHVRLVDLIHGGQKVENALVAVKLLDKVLPNV